MRTYSIKHMRDDSAALLACRTEDGENFLGHLAFDLQKMRSLILHLGISFFYFCHFDLLFSSYPSFGNRNKRDLGYLLK